MSGRIPKRCCAPPRATRKPVITSSKISSAPWRVREFAQRFQKSRRGRNAAHVADHRLDDHRGDLSAAFRERLLDGGDRIVRQRDGGFGERLRNARRIGDAERRHARSGFHQQRIDVPVIAAFELDGQVAAGESARHAQRAHGGFGAGIDQAHHFHRRHDLRDQLGQFDFAFGGRAETGAAIRALRASASITGCGRCPSSSGPHEPT